MADTAQFRVDIERFKSTTKQFASIDEDGVARLAEIAREAAYKPNETIVEEGQAADTFYIVTQGGVRVVTGGRSEDKEVARMGAGGFFGEMGILNDEPRTASVRAIGETRCLLFEKVGLLAVLEEYPQVLHALGSVGVERAGKLVDAQDEE